MKVEAGAGRFNNKNKLLLGLLRDFGLLGKIITIGSDSKVVDIKRPGLLQESQILTILKKLINDVKYSENELINMEFSEYMKKKVTREEMKYLYETDELLKFVSACLGVSPIYRWADPLACHAYNVMKPDGILPWHFDSCEFTLSLMIQKPEKGGIFEYCPNIREPGNENFDEVKKVLNGDRLRVRQLKLEPGDLQIFKGRFTLHRVTKVEGNKSRYMCIPAYVLDPWRVNTPEHSKAIYGKVLPIHLERNVARSDGLTD